MRSKGYVKEDDRDRFLKDLLQIFRNKTKRKKINKHVVKLKHILTFNFYLCLVRVYNLNSSLIFYLNMLLHFLKIICSKIQIL